MIAFFYSKELKKHVNRTQKIKKTQIFKYCNMINGLVAVMKLRQKQISTLVS